MVIALVDFSSLSPFWSQPDPLEVILQDAENFEELLPAIEKIKSIFKTYEQNAISPSDIELLGKLADHACTKKTAQLEKVAAIFLETTFPSAVINRLILSVTPSPAPPKENERVMLLAWARFFKQFSPLYTEHLGNVHSLVCKLYKPEEIQSDPFLSSISSIASQITKSPSKHPKQLEFINNLSAWFLKCYILQPLCADVLTQEAVDQIADNFKGYFSLISESIFTRTGRPLTSFEKKLIFKMMKSFSKYLGALKQTLEKEPTINTPAFTDAFSRNLCARAFDKKQTYEEIHQKVMQLLSFFSSPKEPKILPLLTATALINFIKYMVNPEVTPFIIEQILQRGIPHFEESYSPKSDDPHFAGQIGKECSKICNLFFGLGAKSRKIDFVTGCLNVWLEFNERKIGTLIHETLNKVTSRELLLEPFRIASTVLFKDEEQPIFREHLNQTHEEKTAYCARTKERFLTHLYPVIITLIESFNSVGAGFVKGESTQTYCTTLGEKVWEISQNSDLMLLLIYELFNGISEAIGEEE